MMPSFDEMYAFLLGAYKAERFEARNSGYCPDYSLLVTKSKLESLYEKGYFCIPRNESANGKVRFLTYGFAEYEGRL